jgi:hypothetical protein
MSRNVLAKVVRRSLWIGALRYYGYAPDERPFPEDRTKVQAEFLRRIRNLKVDLYTAKQEEKIKV